MDRLRLWGYKKLANENVKEEKAIEKHSDDEDYNSCFKLKQTLKVREEKFFLICLCSTMHLPDVKQSQIKQLPLPSPEKQINY